MLRKYTEKHRFELLSDFIFIFCDFLDTVFLSSCVSPYHHNSPIQKQKKKQQLEMPHTTFGRPISAGSSDGLLTPPSTGRNTLRGKGGRLPPHKGGSGKQGPHSRLHPSSSDGTTAPHPMDEDPMREIVFPPSVVRRLHEVYYNSLETLSEGFWGLYNVVTVQCYLAISPPQLEDVLQKLLKSRDRSGRLNAAAILAQGAGPDAATSSPSLNTSLRGESHGALLSSRGPTNATTTGTTRPTAVASSSISPAAMTTTTSTDGEEGGGSSSLLDHLSLVSLPVFLLLVQQLSIVEGLHGAAEEEAETDRQLLHFALLEQFAPSSAVLGKTKGVRGGGGTPPSQMAASMITDAGGDGAVAAIGGGTATPPVAIAPDFVKFDSVERALQTFQLHSPFRVRAPRVLVAEADEATTSKVATVQPTGLPFDTICRELRIGQSAATVGGASHAFVPAALRKLQGADGAVGAVSLDARLRQLEAELFDGMLPNDNATIADSASVFSGGRGGAISMMDGNGTSVPQGPTRLQSTLRSVRTQSYMHSLDYSKQKRMPMELDGVPMISSPMGSFMMANRGSRPTSQSGSVTNTGRSGSSSSTTPSGTSGPVRVPSMTVSESARAHEERLEQMINGLIATMNPSDKNKTAAASRKRGGGIQFHGTEGEGTTPSDSNTSDADNDDRKQRSSVFYARKQTTRLSLWAGGSTAASGGHFGTQEELESEGSDTVSGAPDPDVECGMLHPEFLDPLLFLSPLAVRQRARQSWRRPWREDRATSPFAKKRRASTPLQEIYSTLTKEERQLLLSKRMKTPTLQRELQTREALRLVGYLPPDAAQAVYDAHGLVNPSRSAAASPLSPRFGNRSPTWGTTADGSRFPTPQRSGIATPQLLMSRPVTRQAAHETSTSHGHHDDAPLFSASPTAAGGSSPPFPEVRRRVYHTPQYDGEVQGGGGGGRILQRGLGGGGAGGGASMMLLSMAGSPSKALRTPSSRLGTPSLEVGRSPSHGMAAAATNRGGGSCTPYSAAPAAVGPRTITASDRPVSCPPEMFERWLKH